MKKMTMKVMACLLTAALALGAFPVNALASEVSEEEETVQLPGENQGEGSDETDESGETEPVPETESETGAPETQVPETEAQVQRHVVAIDENHVIPQGVHVNGEDISGLTVAEARKSLEAMADEILKGNLDVTVGENKAEIPFTSFNMKMDEASVIEDICGIGEYGDLMTRYRELADVAHSDVNFTLPFTFSEKALSQVIAFETSDFNTDPVDATIVRHDGELIITPETMGIVIDADATAAEVTELVADSWDGKAIAVEAVREETAPEHVAADLEVIQDLIGGYSTDFSGSSSNRCSNIAHGASFLDELVIWPGEEFSFLEHVCPLNTANGYLEATGYSGNKVVPSVGGGICQVSTTLYNAVLRAELEVTKRDNHGLTVSYVPLGADATISESSCDFKFVNNLDYPIYIEAYTYGSQIYINIYGKETRPENRSIDFESVTEKTITPGDDVITEDPDKPAGYREVTQSAHTGYVASYYKLVYVDGSLTDRILINTSTYRASPRYITVGASVPETSAPETSAPETSAPETSAPETSAPDPTPEYEPEPDQEAPEGGFSVD